MSGSNAFYIYHLTHLAILIILEFEWLSTFTFTFFQRIQSMTSWNIIVNSGLMEIFLQNFICLKTMLQILLKSGRLALVLWWAGWRINSQLHIPGCSLLQNVLETCCKSITVASIQKAKWLNSKMNFVEKWKQPCS